MMDIPESRIVNVQALCKDAAQMAGQWSLAGMPRLVESLFATTDDDAPVEWQAAGSLRPSPGGEPQTWLHLQARVPVVLQCQRCLQPMPQLLQVDREFRFVRSAQEAERLDETVEEDVLELVPRLDLHELLEDELILALPLVPRHDGTCPTPLPQPVDDLEEVEPAPNPFAALAALRRDGGQSGGGGVN